MVHGPSNHLSKAAAEAAATWRPPSFLLLHPRWSQRTEQEEGKPDAVVHAWTSESGKRGQNGELSGCERFGL